MTTTIDHPPNLKFPGWTGGLPLLAPCGCEVGGEGTNEALEGHLADKEGGA